MYLTPEQAHRLVQRLTTLLKEYESHVALGRLIVELAVELGVDPDELASRIQRHANAWAWQQRG